MFTNQYYKYNFNLADTHFSEENKSKISDSSIACNCEMVSNGSRKTSALCMKHGKEVLSDERKIFN